VTFSSADRIRTKHELSRIDNQEFHGMVGDLHADGQTAIWDALMKAKDMLVAFKNEHPETKLRIIALTDGEDNQSKHRPADVCRSLYDSDIVLDSIVIGSKTKHLFNMSNHTGGYAFCPSSRSLLFQIFLLEPFLDISVRPDIVKVPITDYLTSIPKKQDMMTIYDFPPCRRHPLEAGSFLDMRQATQFFASRSSRSTSGMTSSLAQDRVSNRPGVRQFFNSPLPVNSRPMGAASIRSDLSGASSGRIYLSEVTQMANNLPSDMDIYVSESDMSFWKVVLAGPPDTPYAAGAFILTVQMSQTFPQLPPTVRFVTPILHPNITKHGRICHQIFTKGWKTSYHVSNVLDEMRNLLREPMMNDAVDELASFKFWSDRETADEEIRRYVNHFALRPRSGLRTEIMSS
jgi:ubiquitin-protein ligase